MKVNENGVQNNRNWKLCNTSTFIAFFGHFFLSYVFLDSTSRDPRFNTTNPISRAKMQDVDDDGGRR